MPLVSDYFDNLNSIQKEQFARLDKIYPQINNLVNLVSRKDIDNLTIHHVLHSLAIAKVINFERGQKILDIGTGGGFPGIPLAIMFPDVQFLLVDSIGKKIEAVKTIAIELGLKNVTTLQARVEDVPGGYNWAVCRAVGRLDKVWPLVKDKVARGGLIYLKGGDYSQEIPVNIEIKSWPIAKIFPEIDFFETKYVLLLKSKKISA